MPSAAFLLFLTLLCPNLERLGSDDWSTREVETQRLDNFLSPLLLPKNHSNPEIDARVKFLRIKNLKWCNPWWQEQVLKKNDYSKWAYTHLATGKTGYHREELLWEILKDGSKRVHAKAALPDVVWGELTLWQRIEYHEDLTAWDDLLDYHWRIAPYPKEVRP